MSTNTGIAKGICGASPSMEMLEPRLLLSGDVTAIASGANLVLIGDADNNDIVVTVQGSGSFEVKSGTTTTTTINGGTDPVDFTGITGSVYAFMGAGDDLLQFTLTLLTPEPGVGDIPANISGDLYVDMGPGNNAFSIGSGGEEIAGNMTVVNGPGNNSVSGEHFIVDGAVTVLNGWGSADTEFNDCTFGSLFIQSAGGTILPEGAPPAGYATNTFLNELTLTGDLNILNGVGNDDVVMDTVTAADGYINNGPDGQTEVLMDSAFAGSLLLYKGDGGTVQVSGSSPGSSDSGTHEAASYTVLTAVNVGTTLISHDGTGLDELIMDEVTVGTVPKGLGRPDAPAGVMFIDTEEDASFIVMDDVTVNGPTLVKQDGGSDTIAVDGFETTTALIVGPLLDQGSNVGNGAANQFYGDFTVINGPGNDGVAFDDAHFWGNVTVYNGQDAAAFGVFDSFFEGALTWVRGDGGTLPSIPTFFNPTTGADKPVGFTLTDASSYVTIQTATVTGPLTILNGAGFNYAEITGLTLNGRTVSDPQAPAVDTGNLLVVNGWGQAVFLMDTSTVSGWATIVDVGGPNTLPGLALPVFYDVTDTEIGQVSTGLGVDNHNVDIGGNLTILTGPGGDTTHLRDVWVGGNVLVGNGPDAAIVTLEQSSAVDGSLTILRGDATPVVTDSVGDPSLGTSFTAGEDEVIDSSVAGSTLIINGSGGASVSLDTNGDGMTGDVNVINGAGYQYFVIEGVFGGSVNLYGGASTARPVVGLGTLAIGCTVVIGMNAAPVQIAGNLFIQTGAYDDRVSFFDATVTGKTTLDTGLGSDTVAIDDSSFTGTVDITTGPDFGSVTSLQSVGPTDDDTVNIEQVTGTSLGTSFAATLTLKTGIGDDTVNIGVADNTAGLGATTNNCFADFAVSPTLDGGDGSDTLNYLLNGNVFEAGATMSAVNFETVV